MKKTLTVSEARRRLPGLIREIARGGGPFYVGARGEAQAVLVSVADHASRGGAAAVSEELGFWEPLRLEIVGSPETLVRDIRLLREEAVAATLAKADRFARPPSEPVAKRRARRKRQ